MLRTVCILILLVLGFALVFAPATLLRHAIPPDANVALSSLSGTLWDGEAVLLIGARNAGRLSWDFAPVTILQGALGYHLALSGPGQALEADLQLRPARVEAVVNGTAQGSYLNAWLAAYDIQLSGEFSLVDVKIAMPYTLSPGAEPRAGPAAANGSAGGRLTWDGGPIRYRLSGQDYSGALPPLEARVGDGLEVVVYASGNETPLLRAELLANGFVRLGMTRLLTRMLNNPWPGGDADHEVVLEVEEQLL